MFSSAYTQFLTCTTTCFINPLSAHSPATQMSTALYWRMNVPIQELFTAGTERIVL